MVNWSSYDIEEWMTEARNIQQELFENLGDREWDYIERDKKWALEKKVGFAMYGEPKELPSKIKKYGYEPDDVQEIYRICDLIYVECGHDSDIYIAFIFAVGKIHEKRLSLPIFRVQKPSGIHVFLDHSGRVYKSWDDFRTKNTLPECLLCYPENGIYRATSIGLVKLTYDSSPACKLSSRACRALDGVSTGVALGAAAVCVAGIFLPVAAPIMLAATVGGAGSGAYGVVRGSHQLYDRAIHKQSISLGDSESRNTWLTVLGGVFGIGSTLAITGAAEIAASGNVLGKTGQCVVNFFNFGALTVSGLGVANGVGFLVERYERNELTTLDVVQWSASLFFFSNSLVNVKTANGIIKDVQEGIKKDFTDGLSKRRMRAFKRIVKESSGEGVIQDNARIIKGISNIGSKDEFFRLVIKAQKVNKATTKLTQDGRLQVRGQLFMDTRAGISQPINYGQNGKTLSLSVDDAKCVRKVLFKVKTMVEAICKEMDRTSIKISDNVEFVLKGDLEDRLINLISRYFSSSTECTVGKGEISSLIDGAEKLARDKGCTTKEGFIGYAEFLCIYKRSKLYKMEQSYQEEKSGMLCQIGDDFSESGLNEKWHIVDSNDREGSFLRVISQEIEQSNENLRREYDKYNKDVEILNLSGEIKFRTKYDALNQFYHCLVIDLDENLTPHEYFEIIRNTAQNEEFKLGTHHEDENGTCILYSDPNVPVAVKVLKASDGLFFEYTVFQCFDDFKKEL